MKNGNKEGTTEFAHKERPVLADERLLLENTNRKIVNKHIQEGINNLFNLSIMNFILYMYTPLITYILIFA